MTEPIKKVKTKKPKCICYLLPADLVHYPSMKKCAQMPKSLINLSNWEKKYDNAGFLKPAKEFILDLLAQQAAETRLATIDECAETFRKETKGVCHAACNKPLYLGSIYEKLKSLKEQTN